MFKKVYAVILSFVLLLSLTGCGSENSQPLFDRMQKMGYLTMKLYVKTKNTV